MGPGWTAAQAVVVPPAPPCRAPVVAGRRRMAARVARAVRGPTARHAFPSRQEGPGGRIPCAPERAPATARPPRCAALSARAPGGSRRAALRGGCLPWGPADSPLRAAGSRAEESRSARRAARAVGAHPGRADVPRSARRPAAEETWWGNRPRRCGPRPPGPAPVQSLHRGAVAHPAVAGRRALRVARPVGRSASSGVHSNSMTTASG